MKNKAKKMIRRRFNLIEVTMALAVVAIGLMSVTVLFPIGANANRDAIGENYAADAGEQMLTYLANSATSNWTTFWTKVASNLSDISSVPADISSWSPVSTNLYQTTVGGNYVYRLVQGTQQGSLTDTDFDAVIRIWQSPVYGWSWNSGAWTTKQLWETDSQLNIEISWPATIPYSGRQKAYYSMEVIKQQ